MSSTHMFPGYWFSQNPDKAWAEKFFLGFTPFWFAYNLAMQKMGWLDTGTFWNITQNLLMWLPYCVALPWYLRRHSGIRWSESYWFKFNVYIFWWVFIATYFHTEYFFDVLGMRYRFPSVSLHLDSALCGPDEATALVNSMKVPPSMYLNATAFFIVYHASAIVVMRRMRSMSIGWPRAARFISWAAIVAGVAVFWAWAETWFYFKLADNNFANVWYQDLERMLVYGSWFYALYFIVSFPNLYRMDEAAQGGRWSLSRVFVEASFVGMISLLLLDLATHAIGGKI